MRERRNILRRKHVNAYKNIGIPIQEHRLYKNIGIPMFLYALTCFLLSHRVP
jgi:hypothetical protein